MNQSILYEKIESIIQCLNDDVIDDDGDVCDHSSAVLCHAVSKQSISIAASATRTHISPDRRAYRYFSNEREYSV